MVRKVFVRVVLLCAAALGAVSSEGVAGPREVSVVNVVLGADNEESAVVKAVVDDQDQIIRLKTEHRRPDGTVKDGYYSPAVLRDGGKLVFSKRFGVEILAMTAQPFQGTVQSDGSTVLQTGAVQALQLRFLVHFKMFSASERARIDFVLRYDQDQWNFYSASGNKVNEIVFEKNYDDSGNVVGLKKKVVLR